MVKIICSILLCVSLIVVGNAHAGAITKFYGSKIKVYKDHRGTKHLKDLKKSEVDTPAAQLSKESPGGYIQIAIPFKDKSKKPVVGWVRKRQLKIDSNRTINVGSCKSISVAKNTAAMQTHGSRGLGDGC